MNKKIKFVEELPFEDENLFPPDPYHLIIPNDIFQASDHPDVGKIFIQYRYQMSSMMLA